MLSRKRKCSSTCISEFVYSFCRCTNCDIGDDELMTTSSVQIMYLENYRVCNYSRVSLMKLSIICRAKILHPMFVCQVFLLLCCLNFRIIKQHFPFSSFIMSWWFPPLYFCLHASNLSDTNDTVTSGEK